MALDKATGPDDLPIEAVKILAKQDIGYVVEATNQVIRHRYAILYVIDINVKHVHRHYPFSHPELSGTARCILELVCICNNDNDLPGFTKRDVDTMINALCTC